MKIVVLDGDVINPGDISWAPLEKLGEVAIYGDTPEDLCGLPKAESCWGLL